MAEERIKRAVRGGELQDLTLDSLRELGVGLDEGVGLVEYNCLHWACHYGKAEVKKPGNGDG